MSNPVYTGPDQERQETSLGIVHRAYMALDACVRALTVRYDANIGATAVHDAKRAMEALQRLPQVLNDESDRYQLATANESLDINVGVLSERLARVQALHDRWAAMGHTMGYLPTFLAELSAALLPDASVERD